MMKQWLRELGFFTLVVVGFIVIVGGMVASVRLLPFPWDLVCSVIWVVFGAATAKWLFDKFV